eukprot:7628848-Karenia_brevis.AAC.1
MSLSDDQLALTEESLKTEYNNEFPAGLANAVPAPCIDTYGKQNLMRVATSFFCCKCIASHNSSCQW